MISDGLNYEERVALSRIVMDILHRWKLSNDAKITLLDLPAETRNRSLHKYSDDTPLPDEANVMLRVEHLLAISEALRTMYPMNAYMAERWLRVPHRRFAKRSPMQMMLEEGLDGLVSVRAELDVTFAWDCTGSSR